MADTARLTSQILREARALISVPERWTKGFLARDAYGIEVRADSPDAVCWCSEGAIARVAGKKAGALPLAILRVAVALEDDTGYPTAADWNDDSRRTHAEVMAAFARAIEIAEAEERADG